MAIEKQLIGRIIHKHDIEENWNKATGFIPKQGEIIVYDIDDNYNYERFKIGDGNTTVVNLPFQKTNINDLKAVSYDIAQTLTDEQKAQARTNINSQEKLTGSPDQIITFDEHGNTVAEDTANADDALITLAELGIITPAQQDGIIYTDHDGKILNI